MKEEIPKLKEMMKELAVLKDKVTSEGNKQHIQDIIMDIKLLAELLDY